MYAGTPCTAGLKLGAIGNYGNFGNCRATLYDFYA
jgi:hypothetical protein